LFYCIDQFKSEVESLVRLHYTVNMEYTSPSNHVVLFYPRPQLTVLSIRSHLDGQTYFGTRLTAFLVTHNFVSILKHLVSFENIPSHLPTKQLMESIRQEAHGEGYVVEIIDSNQISYLAKIKTDKYLLLHQTKFSLNDQRLFENVINEQSDDLRSLFRYDQEALRRITTMEQQVRPQYNQMIESVEEFHRENKHLTRKEYAQLVTGRGDMKVYMGLLMNLYVGKENDYKTFATRHAKDLFRIKNDTISTADNGEKEE
jgi:T4 RnlA family RNA ligase